MCQVEVVVGVGMVGEAAAAMEAMEAAAMVAVAAVVRARVAAAMVVAVERAVRTVKGTRSGSIRCIGRGIECSAGRR